MCVCVSLFVHRWLCLCGDAQYEHKLFSLGMRGRRRRKKRTKMQFDEINEKQNAIGDLGFSFDPPDLLSSGSMLVA